MNADNTNDSSMNGHDINEDDVKPLAQPKFVGMSRQISVAALRERIESQFLAETTARPDILLYADDAARRDLIREVTDYVLATESISLSRPERLMIQDTIFTDMFRFGPLAGYFNDPKVTEITIDGSQRIHVRYGADDMITVDTTFDDEFHLERAMQGILSTAKAELSANEPILEVGTTVYNRPVRLTVFAPPVSPMLHIEVRLHPVQPTTVGTLPSDFDPAAVKFIQSIINAGHGLMIVGDVGTGKTTLLEALLPLLPPESIIVERAAELRIPNSLERLTAVPSILDQPPVTFADQIDAAITKNPSWLVVDEVRFDEAAAIWRAINADSRPSLLWVFRGATEPMRLRSAFSMSVRRAVPGIGQEFIHNALFERLPFVVLMVRQNQKLRLLSINAWQPDPNQPDTLLLKELWPSATTEPIHKLG